MFCENSEYSNLCNIVRSNYCVRMHLWEHLCVFMCVFMCEYIVLFQLPVCNARKIYIYNIYIIYIYVTATMNLYYILYCTKIDG